MSIFSEVKEHLTARKAAEYYGLEVRKNGTACCPFHDDRHPSMKIDRNYHCFACGAGGDVIDYVSRMFGLSQYEAALKLAEDFRLQVAAKGKTAPGRQEKESIRKEKEERERTARIKEKFKKWQLQSIGILKECLAEIEASEQYLRDKPQDAVFSEDYAGMVHVKEIVNYWLDILCMGNTEEKQELFFRDRKEVGSIAGRIRDSRKRIMAEDRGSSGCRNRQRGGCAR